jgi:hypothetical protein
LGYGRFMLYNSAHAAAYPLLGSRKLTTKSVAR